MYLKFAGFRQVCHLWFNCMPEDTVDDEDLGGLDTDYLEEKESGAGVRICQVGVVQHLQDKHGVLVDQEGGQQGAPQEEEAHGQVEY